MDGKVLHEIESFSRALRPVDTLLTTADGKKVYNRVSVVSGMSVYTGNGYNIRTCTCNYNYMMLAVFREPGCWGVGGCGGCRQWDGFLSRLLS